MAGGAEVARERATSVTVTWDPHTERTTAAPSPALSGPCDPSATPTKCSERLLDGRKTPDYVLYSELFTPELARQIVLGNDQSGDEPR